MKSQKNEWYYGDEQTGQWVGPMTLTQLDELYKAGKIEEFIQVINSQMLKQGGPMAQGLNYSMIARINVDFSPTPEEFLKARQNKAITVLSGPNNCGKTLLLKQLFSVVGQGGYLIGCNRFSHVDVLNTRQIDKYQHRSYYDNFVRNLYTARQNTEDNQLNLQEVITTLKDSARDKLFAVCEELLGNVFSLQRTDPENTFSPYYVNIDGENLRVSSTGTRLLLVLLGTLLDDRFTTLLIDEPELGLSPRIQSSLADFLYDSDRRSDFSPHLKQLYIATHSHLFLDRRVLSNNFIVTKAGSAVSIAQVTSTGDLHQLQFEMLGNDLESLFLPSAIVIVEGDSDVTYIRKLAQIYIPDRKITVARAGGDGEVQNKLNFLREAFGDISTSPYRERLFVILDKKHSIKKKRITNQGVIEGNVAIWSKNGIEYFYPKAVIAEAFRCEEGDVPTINVEADPIEHNGIRLSKKELSTFVTERVTNEHRLDDELKSLITKIAGSCNSHNPREK